MIYSHCTEYINIMNEEKKRIYFLFSSFKQYLSYGNQAFDSIS